MPAATTWIDDLATNGWAIVKGVVPKAKADAYASAGLDWLEKFPLGFKRDDVATWDRDHLPDNWKNGVFNFYGVAHEQWVWSIRQEPGIVDAFSQLWKTDDLLVSFDGINITLPVGPSGRTDVKPTSRWPHMDQSPRRPGFQLAQGIFCATESGPDDGGLVLLSGSHVLAQKMFDETGGYKEEQDRGADVNSYQYSEEDCKWFMNQPGVKEVKVEAEAGDLILWDSRTVHWNRAPSGSRTRVATYVCYCPSSYAEDATKARKAEIFAERKATTHWPQLNVVPEDAMGGPKRNGAPCPHEKSQPFEQPVLSEVGRKLAGLG